MLGKLRQKQRNGFLIKKMCKAIAVSGGRLSCFLKTLQVLHQLFKFYHN